MRHMRWTRSIGRILLQRVYTAGERSRRLSEDHKPWKCEVRPILRKEKVRFSKAIAPVGGWTGRKFRQLQTQTFAVLFFKSSAHWQERTYIS